VVTAKRRRRPPSRRPQDSTWTAAGEAQIDQYEQNQRDRELDDDAAGRAQDAYERSLGWGVD
jgi:hypothetical protein